MLRTKLGNFDHLQKYPRDILVKFPDWIMKRKRLELFWEQPRLMKEGELVSYFFKLNYPQKKEAFQFFYCYVEGEM